MLEEILVANELQHSGTSWTRNESFDKNGYLYMQNIIDPKLLYCPLPDKRGQLRYYDKGMNDFEHVEQEEQVEGSLARYWYPPYRQIHSLIRVKIEEAIGRKLYNTYYYDRFYLPGQELKKHTDRAACEISISIHISSNIKEHWPIFIKTPDVVAMNSKSSKQKTFTEIEKKGDVVGVRLNPGDGVLYKGCERPHWRDRMPGTFEMMKIGAEQLYYHQIFFHYVLQDGIRAHHAWDKCN